MKKFWQIFLQISAFWPALSYDIPQSANLWSTEFHAVGPAAFHYLHCPIVKCKPMQMKWSPPSYLHLTHHRLANLLLGLWVTCSVYANFTTLIKTGWLAKLVPLTWIVASGYIWAKIPSVTDASAPRFHQCSPNYKYQQLLSFMAV